MKCKGWNPQLVIPSTFEQCITYEKQILWLYHKHKENEERIEELETEVNDLKTLVETLTKQ